MFIEKLIEENPELVKKAVRKFCKIDEKIKEEYRNREDVYEFIIYSHGSGVFYIDGRYSSDGWTHDMKVSMEDFCISYTDDTQKGGTSFCQCHPTVVKTEWMKFMNKACGDKYIQKFIELRNRGLKKCEARYKSAGKAIEKYKYETERLLLDLGIDTNKDEQNQVK